MTEFGLLLKKYEEKLIIAKYPDFINELDNYGIAEDVWGTDYYGRMKIIKIYIFNVHVCSHVAIKAAAGN